MVARDTPSFGFGRVTAVDPKSDLLYRVVVARQNPITETWYPVAYWYTRAEVVPVLPLLLPSYITLYPCVAE